MNMKPRPSSSKQKGSAVSQADCVKVLQFLRNSQVAQKPIVIARACGHTHTKDINPILYHLLSQQLVEKFRVQPPLWRVPHNAGQVIPPPRPQNYPDHTPQRFEGSSAGGFTRYQPKRMHGKMADKFHKNTGRIGTNYPTDNALLKAGAAPFEASMSNGLVQGHQPVNCVSLFQRTINDKTAPGAYRLQGQLQHSNQKRLESFDSHRRRSPNYPNTMNSEAAKVQHQQSSEVLPSTSGTSSQYSPRIVATSSSEPDDPLSVEANVPDLFNDSSTDVATMDDDSEDEDLNFRISEVISIRDQPVRADLGVVKDSGVRLQVQNYGDHYLAEDQHGSTFNVVTSELMESEEEDDYSEQCGYSSQCQGEDPEPPQGGQCLQLLHLLSELPLQSTTKDFLASELHIPQGDVTTLLDACHRQGWVDFSPLNHVRLTEDGNGHISASSLNYGPEAFRNERQKGIIEHVNVPKSFQDSSANGSYGAGQSSSLAGQVNPSQGVGQRGKNLMPWLSLGAQTIHNQSAMQPAEPPLSTSAGRSSLLPTPQTASLPQATSFQAHTLQDIRPHSQMLEYSTFGDYLKPGKTVSQSPHATFLSQQEYLQQKRPALLSTPESSSFPRYSPGSGKLALLPYPGQPTSQLQLQQQAAPTSLQISTESFAALNKNPISAFMEYGQCRHTPARIEVLSQSGPSHKPVFAIAAVLGNRVFPGITSSNKKDGKKDAAEQAIRILIAEGQYNMPASSSVMSIPESSMTPFDKIAALTHHKFNQLIAVIPESLVGRKVIAGLVMKMSDADTGTVVAIGSGNRCITGDKLSLRGLTLNDCHAEIITRRGFIRFLYRHLSSYDAKKPHHLFEKSSTGKLRMRRSISFHLYISTAPCGDGALFSPRDVVSNNVTLTDSCSSHRPTFDTNVQGVLRTKMEGGEGTIPVDPEKVVQTWDGIVRGERLRTMSCSDKICRWNVVGLQGALLANLLDPVYLSSITLGFLFDAGHLSRAVCCRLNRGEPSLDRCLPFPYHLNHPVLGRVTACDATRETQKTKSYSINWMVEDDKPEIVDGCQGTCYTGDKSEPSQASRLCKKYLFDSYNQTCHILGQTALQAAPTYLTAKRQSTQFYQAKEAMFNKFKDTNCGIWLGKPAEEKMFS